MLYRIAFVALRYLEEKFGGNAMPRQVQSQFSNRHVIDGRACACNHRLDILIGQL
jgi:hypothetical protein